MSDERHSDADAPPLIADEEERATREALNAVAQFDRVLDHIDTVERDGRAFRLRLSVVQDLHRLAWMVCPPMPATGGLPTYVSARAATSRRPRIWSPD